MIEMIVAMATIFGPSAGFLVWWLVSGKSRSRRQPELEVGGDWDDQNPPTGLNYNYIDWLERELEVGQYDRDAIAIQIAMLAEEAKEQCMVAGFHKITEEEWCAGLKQAEGLWPVAIAAHVPERRRGMVFDQLDALRKRYPDVKPEFLAIGLVWRYRAGGEFDEDNGRVKRRLRRTAESTGLAMGKTRGPVRRIIGEDGEWTEIRAFGS